MLSAGALRARTSDPVKTLVICDTEPIATEGLRALLAGSDLCIAAAETCLATGIEAVREMEPSMVLIDKNFGLHSVLDAVRALALAAPEVHIAVWSSALTDSETLRLMHAGALGVVRKTMPLEQILDCLRSVAAGVAWMGGSAAYHQGGFARARTPLTARERQVLELVEHGLTNREIAMQLGIRAGTVKIHLKHIFEKTGVRGRYGLALSGMKDRCLAPAPVLV
jgi:DNA-binding NarL/FixJ family response regulator